MEKKPAVYSAILLTLCFPALIFGAELTNKEQLGRVMYQDKNFSLNATQSCQTCHHHISGYADPDNMRNPLTSVVSVGDDGISMGGRNAPSSAYCGYSPALHLRADGIYVGGLFWDGRADGSDLDLQDPLAEQAQGPPLNPVEMNMPSVEAVVDVVRNASYRQLFLRVFGRAAFNDNDKAFDYIAQAIAAYERSAEVQKFSSRYDFSLLTEDAGLLTDQEIRGLKLVETHCSLCHPSTVDKTAEYAQVPPAPLFTNYSYANIGIPFNDLLFDNPTDLGLGPIVNDPKQNGKFKVPTLRNVALTAPYGHNGFFPTLRDILDFMSDRSLWDAPEVADNLSMEVGKFNFTDAEKEDIIAILCTLTD